MGSGTNYRQPRRINPVSVTIVLILAAGVYMAYQFGPPYWRKYKVKGLLSEAANGYMARRLARGAGEVEIVGRLHKTAFDGIRAAGVEDAGLQVTLSRTAEGILATAVYKERIRHPFVDRTTTLTFRPHVMVAYPREP